MANDEEATKAFWEEIREFLKTYGDIPVVFASYYKYVFTFENAEQDFKVWFGGMSDDIYRCEVKAGPVPVRDLPDLKGASKDGKIVYDDPDYP